jgi:hypothetical protein
MNKNRVLHDSDQVDGGANDRRSSSGVSGAVERVSNGADRKSAECTTVTSTPHTSIGAGWHTDSLNPLGPLAQQRTAFRQMGQQVGPTTSCVKRLGSCTLCSSFPAASTQRRMRTPCTRLPEATLLPALGPWPAAADHTDACILLTWSSHIQ